MRPLAEMRLDVVEEASGVSGLSRILTDASEHMSRKSDESLAAAGSASGAETTRIV